MSPAGQWVVVPAGGSLWSLAQQYYGDGSKWPVIYAANPQLRPNPNLVIAGSRVFIPARSTAPPSPGAVQAARDNDLALAAAGVLAGAITVAGALALLRAEFTAAGISSSALATALRVVMDMPPERMGAHGPATMAVIRMNLLRRAQFLVTSARRLTADVRSARSRNESVLEALRRGMARERRYYALHLEAGWNRLNAAARTDAAADQYGLLLGWNAMMDARTSMECRLADGKNFRADQMPLIGYPGMVHLHCRCYPGRPHAGAAMLPSARMAA
jgi:hypothetical protein